MNFIKKFTSIKRIVSMSVLLLGFVLNVSAVDVSKNIATTFGTNLLSTPGIVSQIILSTDASSAGTIKLFDQGGTNFFYTNASYTLTTYSSGLVTNIYTNYFGVLTTNTYTALIAGTTTNAAATNLFPLMFMVAVPTNSTLTFDGPYVFNRGILATNASGTGNGVLATVTYR